MSSNNSSDLYHPGSTAINESRPEDVFIVGYPKSGNTWMQCLVAGLAYGCNPSLTPDSVIQDLVPDVHSEKYYHRFGKVTYFKSHDFPAPRHRRVIYILRDGRDAMVSYFHMTKALLKKDIRFTDFLYYSDHFPGKWHDHVSRWTANPYGAEILVVRFEDLISQRVKELQRISEFIGLNPPQEWLLQVANESSFSKMQAKERLQGWDHPDWPKEEMFIRRGEVGSYRDEMSPEVLDFFLNEASPTLKEMGYSVAPR